MTDWAGTATPPSSSATASYVSIAELEAYIGADPRTAAIALKAAADATQLWYCQRATRIIDAIPSKARPIMISEMVTTSRSASFRG